VEVRFRLQQVLEASQDQGVSVSEHQPDGHQRLPAASAAPAFPSRYDPATRRLTSAHPFRWYARQLACHTQAEPARPLESPHKAA
jgi:hypothetical protein